MTLEEKYQQFSKRIRMDIEDAKEVSGAIQWIQCCIDVGDDELIAILDALRKLGIQNKGLVTIMHSIGSQFQRPDRKIETK